MVGWMVCVPVCLYRYNSLPQLRISMTFLPDGAMRDMRGTIQESGMGDKKYGKIQGDEQPSRQRENQICVYISSSSSSDESSPSSVTCK